MGFQIFKTNLLFGQSLIELLVAIGIAAILLPALLTGLIASREGKAQQIQRVEATNILKETQEATRSVRERGWTTFAINGTFFPSLNGSQWQLVPGSQTSNGFTRSVLISDVYRDSSGTIVTSGGTIDPSTKRVVTTVSWTTPLPYSISTTQYLTRYLENVVYTQSTQAEFDTGTHTATNTTNNNGGEVTLGSGGLGQWCSPDLTLGSTDLPKNGVANALTAIEGQAFAGTGDNASGVSFANVSISNTSPPAATVVGTFDGYKTNDVFGENNYAYLATDNNSREVAIVNISSAPYTLSGYFDGSGSSSGNSIFVSGNVGYLVQGNTLRTFDLTSKSGSRPQLGSVSLAGTGTEVHVIGTYAYISISGSSTKLQIINITNPSSPSVVGSASPDSQSAQDVYVNSSGTRAYLVTSSSSTQNELFIVDVSTKTGNRPIVGSYDTNGMSAKGIEVVPGNRAIVVGSGAEEYQVVNISNESSPSRCGGMHIDSGINGIASVLENDGDAYSYIITGDSSSELKIIEGGPGGQYANSGTFESSIFDAGYSTAFNYFVASITTPPNTQIQFHLSVADAVSGSCNSASYIYVGPDGTSSTFYTSTGNGIFINDDGSGYENPGRCFRYKAYFSTSDPSASPILNDVSVNYSP